MYPLGMVLTLAAVGLAWAGSANAGPVYFNTPAGQKLVARAERKADYWALSTTFVTQRTQTLCSVASSVTVLNALPLDKPDDPVFYPYRTFTQENFFNSHVSKAVPLSKVLGVGMTLEQIAEALRANGAAVKVTHGGRSSAEAFRARLIDSLNDTSNFIIVNFLRTGVGQIGEGHFSPVAAYDTTTDRVLLMDVARYKYPPAWLEVDALFDAMTGVDPDSGKTRGWVEVSAADQTPKDKELPP